MQRITQLLPQHSGKKLLIKFANGNKYVATVEHIINRSYLISFNDSFYRYKVKEPDLPLVRNRVEEVYLLEQESKTVTKIEENMKSLKIRKPVFHKFEHVETGRLITLAVGPLKDSDHMYGVSMAVRDPHDEDKYIELDDVSLELGKHICKGRLRKNVLLTDHDEGRVYRFATGVMSRNMGRALLKDVEKDIQKDIDRFVKADLYK